MADGLGFLTRVLVTALHATGGGLGAASIARTLTGRVWAWSMRQAGHVSRQSRSVYELRNH